MTLPHEPPISNQSSPHTAGDSQHSVADPPSSTIYPHRLGSRDFRLICLSAIQDIDYPVHMTIETYPRDCCPEYEAMSYCWGGEDGDSTPSHPIYVGLHWDILFQTQNCWSMLRYLRPRRGVRMVWVDAICINQDDRLEREDQVAAMQNIYQRCMRAVVYLGGDILQGACEFYPARYRLDKIPTSPVSWADLLRRRYFSRVWVIQELILAPSVVIPIGNMEYHITHGSLRDLQNTLSVSLKDNWTWKDSEAPWLRHIANGSPLESARLADILRQSWNSQATDPRDKIFGILGLLNESDLCGHQSLKPDYSISSEHALIGIFAHILINLRDTDVLLNASGLSAKPPYPSWIPEWRNSSVLSKSERDKRYFDKSVFMIAEITGGLQWNHRVLIRPRSPSDELQTGFHDIEVEVPWYQNASVDPSSAGLNMRLIHLLEFDNAPICHNNSYGGLRMNLYQLTTSSCYFFVSTPQENLDLVGATGPYHIFILDGTRKTDHILLVLQQTSFTGKYKLVTLLQLRIPLPCLQRDTEGIAARLGRGAKLRPNLQNH